MSIFQEFAQFFGISDHYNTHKNDIARGYRKLPTIASRLPWMEYNHETHTILLNDNRSLAMVFECEDVPTDSRSPEYLQQMRKKFQRLLQDSIPQEENNPWIVQVYFQKDRSLASYVKEFRDYIKPIAKGSKLSETVIDMLDEHYKYMVRPGGLFVDDAVSQNVFQGGQNRIRLVLYRRLDENTKLRKGRDEVQSIHSVAKSMVRQLRKGAGIKARVCTGLEFWAWMVRWFNPAPALTKGNVDELLERCPFPDPDNMPYGYELTEQLFYSVPESDHDKGIWYFDQHPHKMITIESLSAVPSEGHLSAEKQDGERYAALFDSFPEGSVFAMTIVIQHQNEVKEKVKIIEKSAMGEESDARFTREDCNTAKDQIAMKNFLLPTFMSVYIKGENELDLYESEELVETLLSNNGFKIIKGDFDLYPIDSYLRGLPCCYDYAFDRDHLKRAQLLYVDQIASLLPFYGRSRGSGNPCFSWFNRGGEPITIDPFSRKDKSYNSHLMLTGTTGAGKSSALVYLLTMLVAVYKVRLIMVDAGNSLEMLMTFFKEMGLSTNDVVLDVDRPTPLNPFADALKILEQPSMDPLGNEETPERMVERWESESKTLKEEATEEEKVAENDKRDYLGEMSLNLFLMVTGGEEKAMDAIERADRGIFIETIKDAARTAYEEGRAEVLTEDVMESMKRIAAREKENNDEFGNRIYKFAKSLEVFVEDNTLARFFNRAGRPWPDVDVTRLEMGIMKNKGYEAPMALSYMGVMNKALSIAEASQYEGRLTVIVTDECHVIMKNPTTGQCCTQVSKMSRKLGLWLIMATQNLDDMSGDSRKMLSMMEHWICLGADEEELKKIKQFKTLSPEEEELFRSVSKLPGKYVEGVYLSSRYKFLFRNVPPRLALALALSENDEKQQRRKIMNEHDVSEYEAASKIAKEMLEEMGSDLDAEAFF